jgi:hypothetical protein
MKPIFTDTEEKQIEAIRSATKKALKSKKASRKLLKVAGIIKNKN